MQTTGLLKKSGNVTRKERDGDCVYETNFTQIVLEVPTEALTDEEVAFLARKQNCNVDIEIESTWKPVSKKKEASEQTTIDDAMRENERITKIRRALYRAIVDMAEPSEDVTDEALTLAVCFHFDTLEPFELDGCTYSVKTGGNLPQLWISTKDGENPQLISEGTDLIKEVRWILKNPEDQAEPWRPEIVTGPEYIDDETDDRYFFATVDPENPESELGFYQLLPDGTLCDYHDVPTMDLPLPLSREHAQIALDAWAQEMQWRAVPPNGYGNVYRNDEGETYLVLRDEQDEEGWPVFRAFFYKDGQDPVPCDREDWVGGHNPQDAQEELDDRFEGIDNVQVIGYAKWPDMPVEDVPEEEVTEETIHQANIDNRLYDQLMADEKYHDGWKELIANGATDQQILDLATLAINGVITDEAEVVTRARAILNIPYPSQVADIEEDQLADQRVAVHEQVLESEAAEEEIDPSTASFFERIAAGRYIVGIHTTSAGASLVMQKLDDSITACWPDDKHYDIGLESLNVNYRLASNVEIEAYHQARNDFQNQQGESSDNPAKGAFVVSETDESRRVMRCIGYVAESSLCVYADGAQQYSALGAPFRPATPEEVEWFIDNCKVSACVIPGDHLDRFDDSTSLPEHIEVKEIVLEKRFEGGGRVFHTDGQAITFKGIDESYKLECGL